MDTRNIPFFSDEELATDPERRLDNVRLYAAYALREHYLPETGVVHIESFRPLVILLRNDPEVMAVYEWILNGLEEKLIALQKRKKL